MKDVMSPDNGITVMQELFSSAIRSFPQHIAVELDGQTVSYETLKAAVDKLAWIVAGHGVKKGTPVMVCAQRSIQLVIAVLSVMKAGGVYVPVAPSYSAERLAFIAADCGAALVLHNTHTYPQCMPLGIPMLNIEDGGRETIPGGILPEIYPEDPAYVIYTSGSTGQPKGVLVSHSNLAALITAQMETFHITADERVLLFANYVFDASIEQMFLALCSGARLVLFPEGLQMDIPRFEEFLDRAGITHLHATPSYLAVMSRFNFQALKRVIAGGEVCTSELAARINKEVAFYNEYGPTETTVTATMFYCPAGTWDNQSVLPIGRALKSYAAYILDNTMQAVKPGETGEIYIGGKGVAMGYLNRAALTSQVFLTVAGFPGRLYKTGDRGYFLPDGNIAFAGRTDNQIKVRGVRIEPEEIEAQLLKYEGVRQAVVVACQQQDNCSLTAFVTAAENERPAPAKMIAFLKRSLPAGMIPARIIVLPQLPLNINGKADRQKLSLTPVDDWLVPQEEAGMTGTELILSDIWKQLLGTKVIDPAATFFNQGGHSLLLVKLNLEINKRFAVTIPPDIFFEDPTLHRLAGFIDEQCKLSTVATEEKEIPYGVTPSQRGLYMARRFNPENPFPNAAITFIVEGELNTQRLNTAINHVISMNDSLRTSFHYEKGTVHARVSPSEQIQLQSIDLGEKLVDVAIHEVTAPFDFARAPLMRAFIFNGSDGTTYFHLDMPHIHSDGTSCQIIAEEIFQCYIAQQPVKKEWQYVAFQRMFRNYLSSPKFEQDKAFWKVQALHDIPPLFTPEMKGVVSGGTRGASVAMELSADSAAQLALLSQRYNCTDFHILISVYVKLIHQLTGRDKMNIVVPVQNRNAPELERVTGLLVNTVPIKFMGAGENDLFSFIDSCRKAVLQALSHQQYPFEYLQADYRKAGVRSALYETFFNFHSYMASFKAGNLKWHAYVYAKQYEALPLSVDVYKGQGGLTLRLMSAEGNYTVESLKLIGQLFGKLLSAFCNNEEPFLNSEANVLRTH